MFLLLLLFLFVIANQNKNMLTQDYLIDKEVGGPFIWATDPQSVPRPWLSVINVFLPFLIWIFFSLLTAVSDPSVENNFSSPS